MIRAGLFLYDHLGGRMTLPTSFGVELDRTRCGAGLKPRFRKGFVYSDARVDDARLVVCNAIDARDARRRHPRSHDARQRRGATTACGAQRWSSADGASSK